MILTCPDCDSRYTVPDGSIPAGGRIVRCAACRSNWRVYPEGESGPAPAGAAAPMAAKPAVDDAWGADAAQFFRSEVERRKRRNAMIVAGALWGLTGLGYAAVLAGAYVYRVDIVRAFPSVAGAYAAIGLPVNSSGVVFENTAFEPSFHAGQVSGRITTIIRNVEDKPRPSPPLKVTLYDKAGHVLGDQIVPASGRTLPKGGTERRVFDSPDPTNMADNVVLAVPSVKDLAAETHRLWLAKLAAEAETKRELKHGRSEMEPAERPAAPPPAATAAALGLREGRPQALPAQKAH